MIIRVNNIQKEISENTNITDLLNSLNHTQNGIAVAINEMVVLKNNWNEHLIQENDDILIIQATQGG